MSEAERLAIRQAFAEDLEGTEIHVVGIVGTFEKELAKEGADIVYRALINQKWTVARGEGATGTVDEDDIVDELTGWLVVVRDNVPFTSLPWNYSEKLSREGAEAIVNRMKSKKWVVTD